MPYNAAAEFLTHLPLFAPINLAEAGEIVRRGTIHDLAKGEGLFMQGDVAETFYVVLSGWIKLFTETADGHEAVAGLCGAGDTFGEAAMYRNAHYPHGASAAEPARVLCLPGAVIKELLHNGDDFIERLLETLSKRAHALQLQAEHLAMMTAPQRIGCFLLRLCHHQSKGTAKFDLPVDKGLVASFLGIKAETFSRALHQLQEIGVQISGPKVTVNDIEELREYTCVSCSVEPGRCDTITIEQV